MKVGDIIAVLRRRARFTASGLQSGHCTSCLETQSSCVLRFVGNGQRFALAMVGFVQASADNPTGGDAAKGVHHG